MIDSFPQLARHPDHPFSQIPVRPDLLAPLRVIPDQARAPDVRRTADYFQKTHVPCCSNAHSLFVSVHVRIILDCPFILGYAKVEEGIRLVRLPGDYSFGGELLATVKT